MDLSGVNSPVVDNTIESGSPGRLNGLVDAVGGI